MKPLLLFLFICLSPALLWAQDDIYNEILNYVDSTDVRITQGRKYLTNAVNKNNKMAMRKGLSFLLEEGKGDYKKSMSSFEYIGLCYLTESFDDLLIWMKHANTYKYWPDSQNDHLSFSINQALKENRDEIKKSIATNVREEDAVFVLQSTFTRYTIDVDPTDEYRQSNADFVKNNPLSDYTQYAASSLPMPRTIAGTYFAGGASMIHPKGDYADNFNNGWGGYLSWEFTVNRWYFSLFFQGGSLKTNTAFTLTDDLGSYSFNKNDTFSFFSGGLDFGYDLVKNKTFLLAPAVSVLGGSIQSTLFNDDTQEYFFYNSFVYGFSLNATVKVIPLKDNMEGSYIGLKVRAGREYPISKNISHNFTNGINTFQFGLVWGGGDL